MRSLPIWVRYGALLSAECGLLGVFKIPGYEFWLPRLTWLEKFILLEKKRTQP